MSAPGPVLDGMRFVRGLGSGGFADVLLYEEAKLDRLVAVKIPHAGISQEGVAQFSSEARAMAKLNNHPNVVTVHNVLELRDARPCIVMEYCSGHSLAERVRGARLAVPLVVDTGIKIAGAVAAAHAVGLLHRDIKPANILVDSRAQPRLGDFGIAARADRLGSGQDAVSPPWAAPEVLAGAAGDERADVYSLAATLWHLLAGRSPFEAPGGDNGVAALSWRVQHTAPRPIERPDVPRELLAELTRAMARSPAHRPATARAFADRLTWVVRTTRMSLPEAGFAAPADPDPVTTAWPRPPHPHTAPRPARTTAPPIPPTSPPVGASPAPPPGPSAAPPTRTAQRVPAIPPAPAPVPDGDDRTVVRPQGTKVDRRGARAPALVGAGALVVAAAVGAAIAVGGDGGERAPTTAPAAEPRGQDAGAAGGALPPGKPTVVGERVNSTTVRFTWTYSASMDTDTFRWRTPDDARSGVADTASVEVPAGSGEVCVQVKVVRVGGGSAAVDWSEPGCA